MIWGRGAQDMEGQVAAEIAAATSLARSGWRPAGELLVIVTADEEMGAHKGAKWLCHEHPEKVRSDMVVNEGGGMSFELGGRRFYTLGVGEKGVFRFNLKTRGRAGHASVPALGDNALLKLAPALEALRSQPEPEPTPEGLEFLSIVLGETVDADGLGERARAARRARPPAQRLRRRADAAGDAHPDDGEGVAEGERDPGARPDPGRLPGAARADRGRRPRPRRAR